MRQENQHGVHKGQKVLMTANKNEMKNHKKYRKKEYQNSKENQGTYN